MADVHRFRGVRRLGIGRRSRSSRGRSEIISCFVERCIRIGSSVSSTLDDPAVTSETIRTRSGPFRTCGIEATSTHTPMVPLIPAACRRPRRDRIAPRTLGGSSTSRPAGLNGTGFGCDGLTCAGQAIRECRRDSPEWRRLRGARDSPVKVGNVTTSGIRLHAEPSLRAISSDQSSSPDRRRAQDIRRDETARVELARYTRFRCQ